MSQIGVADLSPPSTRSRPHRRSWLCRTAAFTGALLLCACTSTVAPPGSSTDGTLSTSSVPTGTGPVATTAAPGPDGTASDTTGTSPETSVGTPTEVSFRTVAPDSGLGLRIGLVAAATTNAFDRAVTASIAEQIDLAGAELVTCDPGDDPALLLACAEQLSVQGIDGWILVPGAELGEVPCDVGSEDAILIVVGILPNGCGQAVIGADDTASGDLVGRRLGVAAQQRFDCSPTVLFIVTDTRLNSSALRVDGIRSGYASQCPGAAPHEVLIDADSQEQAYTAFTAAATGLPTDATVLVAAVNDDAALGVLAALPVEPDANNQVVLAAIGSDERARCSFRVDRRWIGDVALFPDRYGELVVPHLFDALEGRAIPEFMAIPAVFLDAESVDEHYPDTECDSR